jgi:tetrapyrrole methylase family protein/MazG family protein
MIHIVGLGPGEYADAAPGLDDLVGAGIPVIVRTRSHPAAETLATRVGIVDCDDLYRAETTFEDVYAAIAERVMAAAERGDVVYAVPGSPTVGEVAVAEIRRRAGLSGVGVRLHPAFSFVDLVFAAVDIDPLRDGFRMLNAHDLPDPLLLDGHVVIGQLDLPEVLADLSARLDRVLDDDAQVCVLRNLGSADADVRWVVPVEIDPGMAGLRTSLYVPPSEGAIAGVIRVMRRLRTDCPWDRKQTHHSLVRYLVEESHELADALAGLADLDPDFGAYADVEEELGDVLLQVLFHATIASESGAFDIEDVAEQLRRKLVRRHPHVFGDVDAADADAVKANWDVIKAAEKRVERDSLLDGIPTSLPGLGRAAEVQRTAAKVGFDWPEIAPVLDKIDEESSELRAVLDDREAAIHELGDLLFSVVNVARHLDIEAEVAIRAATQRFETRFRTMELQGPLEGLTLQELDARWEAAKHSG